MLNDRIYYLRFWKPITSDLLPTRAHSTLFSSSSMDFAFALCSKTAHMLVSFAPKVSMAFIVAKICGSHRRTELTLG